MTGISSYPGSKTAPGEILELFKGGYLSIAETITALDDLIPAPAQGWQDISTAPKDVPVIVLDDPMMGEAYYHADEGTWWWCNTGPGEYTGRPIFPTLWHPMPTLPMPSTPRATPERTMVVGRVTGKLHEGDQVPGMPGAICHACGLKDYPCVNPDCPHYAPKVSSTDRGGDK